ncbi:Cinnamoyl-CoA reductase 1 [Sesamum angolense]|uniref:Cinnamoyl-CoA reductase 1 n=1 Tax=Sesamum angolense TaxID=2727404 RepID=A0AAE1XCP9_9LAMI|nr:Cinnamoyl-CoA reductase 1 [Sesamum angolense]
MEAKRGGEVVCVTGGSGFIGSCLLHLLLRRGYTVHATVKNLEDEKETKHLEAMEGAESRLRLFQIDLLDYDSIVAAVTGVAGVFHVASPCIVDKVDDPQRELLDPAVKGTINVLTAAKEVGVRRVVVTSSISAMAAGPNNLPDVAKDENCWVDEEYGKQNGGELLDPAIKGTINVLTAAKELGVRRVVVTSSISAIIPSPNWPADVVKNEDCWTDEEYCKRKGIWYPLSKTLAEKAAWEFAEGRGLDIVVVNPGTVMGPVIPPALNASMQMLLRLLQGCTEVYEDFFMGSVHVKDVALAHLLVYENTSATGRHLCVEAVSHYGDFAAKVAELYPEYNVPKLPKDTQPGLRRSKDASKKLIDLVWNGALYGLWGSQIPTAEAPNPALKSSAMDALRLLLIFSLISASAAVDSGDKVSFEVYYESLCPYCSNLIVNYLYKLVDSDLISITDFKLVPYGNAKIRPNGTITCQELE